MEAIGCTIESGREAKKGGSTKCLRWPAFFLRPVLHCTQFAGSYARLDLRTDMIGSRVGSETGIGFERRDTHAAENRRD
jgi:hypothetical protein